MASRKWVFSQHEMQAKALEQGCKNAVAYSRRAAKTLRGRTEFAAL